MYSPEQTVQGASLVQQCLRAGLMDELTMSVRPIVLGHGVRLLDGLEPGGVELEILRAEVDAFKKARRSQGASQR